ncbi:phage tail protein [Kribbella sp. CA-293567]|uniref:phage tail protein n=1 Tax=Kribbella sp. CA-293567 TaxID=3002436 RepID=UPI0022DDEB9F|nr:phage tail protein [Kribbella sp. CA-293567]WBQ06496.1 phage tail protein [Kribbella sp. CA-293567]
MAPSLRSVGKGLELLTGQVGMSHRYVIDIDRSGYQLGSWSKAGGLAVSWQRHTYRPGGATHLTIVPGDVSYPNISLSRAAGADSGRVQEWLVTVTRDRTPLSGAIYLVDFLGMPVVTWKLREFFPIGWRLTEFDSGGSRPAIEVLELAHTGFLDAEAKLP